MRCEIKNWRSGDRSWIVMFVCVVLVYMLWDIYGE